MQQFLHRFPFRIFKKRPIPPSSIRRYDNLKKIHQFPRSPRPIPVQIQIQRPKNPRKPSPTNSNQIRNPQNQTTHPKKPRKSLRNRRKSIKNAHKNTLINTKNLHLLPHKRLPPFPQAFHLRPNHHPRHPIGPKNFHHQQPNMPRKPLRLHSSNFHLQGRLGLCRTALQPMQSATP